MRCMENSRCWPVIFSQISTQKMPGVCRLRDHRVDMERRSPQAVVGVIGAEMCGDLQIALHQTLGTSFGAPSGPDERPQVVAKSPQSSPASQNPVERPCNFRCNAKYEMVQCKSREFEESEIWLP